MTAIDQRCKDLIAQGDHLFSKRMPLLSLWQTIADNFYPERADFTVNRNIGEDFAANLLTSAPILARRELGSLFSTMLRPRQDQWFNVGIQYEEVKDQGDKRWLEWAQGVQKHAMYDRISRFTRATSETDHDYSAFGQGVLSCEANLKHNALLYRNWHLRDVAWCEDATGEVDTIHRQWRPTAIEIYQTMKGNVHPKVKELLLKTPYQEIRCRHIIVPTDRYEPIKDAEGNQYRTPFVSLHIDLDNEFIMEEVGVTNRMYIVPRWQTVSGSQYAYSPSTVAALPDARLLQSMTLTLLEAGEKGVNPPMIGQQGAIKSDVAVYAGGITWADRDYDEKLGAVLRPIDMDYSGIPMGMEMRNDILSGIRQAFYLDKVNLPEMTKGITAYEISQRVQEYVRNALPLFEPMETDYNSSLCEITFDVLMQNGAFGSPQDIPKNLQGKDIQFTFTNPLREASDKQKGELFVQSKALLAQAADLDPNAPRMINASVALRDALEGIGTPAVWIRSEEEMAEIEQSDAEIQQAKQMMDLMAQGGAAAEQVGKGGLAIGQAQQAMQGGAVV